MQKNGQPTNLNDRVPSRIMGNVVMSHQGEERAQERDGADAGDVSMHVIVLLLGEQRVVALDATALHVLVPAGLNVGFHQRSFTLA